MLDIYTREAAEPVLDFSAERLEYIEQLPSVTQMLVLPRGVEARGTAFEGRVVHDSAESGDSFDRAALAGIYAATHPEMQQAFFVSHETFAVAPWRHSRGSEARAQYHVARKYGLLQHMAKVAIGEKSRSTLGGIIEARRSGKIDMSQPLGVVVHEDHKRKPMWLGKLVLPGVEIVPLIADDPTRTKPNVDQAGNDNRSDLVYRVALAGVQPGNIDGLLRGAAPRERLVSGAMGVIASAMRIKKAYSYSGRHRENHPNRGYGRNGLPIHRHTT